VVTVRATLLDELVPDVERKRKIEDRAPMEVTELTTPEPELTAAEAVRYRHDSGPRGDDAFELFGAA
jgi:hypothetical protein